MNTPHSLSTPLVGLLLLLFLFAASPALAQRVPGSVGIGGQIGEPSGITVKFYNAAPWSYDFLAAWDLGDFLFLNVHALRERPLGRTGTLHFFYGPGVFIGLRDRPKNQDDDIEVGVSGTFGLGFVVDQFEIYGQLTPRLSVVPDTNGDVGGGIGVRFYF